MDSIIKAQVKAQIKIQIRDSLFDEASIILLVKYFNYNNVFLIENVAELS